MVIPSKFKRYGAFLLSSLLLALSMLGLMPVGQASAHANPSKQLSQKIERIIHTTTKARMSGRRTQRALDLAEPTGAIAVTCFLEECNGQQPIATGCADFSPISVSSAYIIGPNRKAIGAVVIEQVAICGAYYAEVQSYVGPQTGLALITRGTGPNALVYSSGIVRASARASYLLPTIDSPMVGINGEPISATGVIVFNGKVYSAKASFSTPAVLPSIPNVFRPQPIFPLV